MKYLYLLRHGKAAPQSDRGEDRTRGLADRGVSDSIRIGGYCREKSYRPAGVLCSPATRTRETLEAFAKGLGIELPASFPEQLYLASAGQLLHFVQSASDKDASLLMVGHNPGMEELASLLASDHALGKARSWKEALEEKFPTGAFAVLEFKVDCWRDVAMGEGALKAFVRPKDF